MSFTGIISDLIRFVMQDQNSLELISNKLC